MPFKNRFGGGTTDIIGTTKQCKVAAGKAISAGDFVEFSESYILGAPESNAGTIDTQRTDSFQLSDTTSLVVTKVNGTNYISAMVASYNNVSHTVTYGTAVALTSDTSVADTFEKPIIVPTGSANKFLIITFGVSNIYGTFVSVSGNSVIGGSRTVLSNDYSAQHDFAFLSNNRIAIITCDPTDANDYGGYFRVIVLTYTDTSVVVSKNVLGNQAGMSWYPKCVLLQDGKLAVFASPWSNDNKQAYGCVVTITDSNEITFSTKVLLSSTLTMGNYISPFEPITFGSNKIMFQAFGSNDNGCHVFTLQEENSFISVLHEKSITTSIKFNPYACLPLYYEDGIVSTILNFSDNSSTLGSVGVTYRARYAINSDYSISVTLVSEILSEFPYYRSTSILMQIGDYPVFKTQYYLNLTWSYIFVFDLYTNAAIGVKPYETIISGVSLEDGTAGEMVNVVVPSTT